MKKSELFTNEMLEDFICHPTADAPRFIDEGTIRYYNGVNGVNNV